MCNQVNVNYKSGDLLVYQSFPASWWTRLINELAPKYPQHCFGIIVDHTIFETKGDCSWEEIAQKEESNIIVAIWGNSIKKIQEKYNQLINKHADIYIGYIAINPKTHAIIKLK